MCSEALQAEHEAAALHFAEVGVEVLMIVDISEALVVGKVRMHVWKGCSLLCYRAKSCHIRLGEVTLSCLSETLITEATVSTSMLV